MTQTKQRNQTKLDAAWDRVLKPWWGKMGVGALALVLSLFIWNQFAKLESGERESMLIDRSLAFMYDIGGKPLAAGLPALAGAGFIVWGAMQLARGKEQ